MDWYVRRGRLSRRNWWVRYWVPLTVLALAAALVDSLLGYPGAASEPWWQMSPSVAPVSYVVSMLSLVPGVTSMVARLHDRGHSAWWLLWLLVPVLGWFLVVVEACFLRGEPFPNAYGPPEERTLTYA